jgi:hypothetical protein
MHRFGTLSQKEFAVFTQDGSHNIYFINGKLQKKPAD